MPAAANLASGLLPSASSRERSFSSACWISAASGGAGPNRAASWYSVLVDQRVEDQVRPSSPRLRRGAETTITSRSSLSESPYRRPSRRWYDLRRGGRAARERHGQRESERPHAHDHNHSLRAIFPLPVTQTEKSGRLLVVGTPIGNLDDLSPRARKALTESDAIFCEDTRVTAKLASRFGISARTSARAPQAGRERNTKALRRTMALVSD
jgi:hypothetical protein